MNAQQSLDRPGKVALATYIKDLATPVYVALLVGVLYLAFPFKSSDQRIGGF